MVLEFPCQILVFIHFLLLLLLYSCVSGHCDIYQECRLVVLLYDYNIWSSVFNHVVRLDTCAPQDFAFFRLYHWFSHCSECCRPHLLYYYAACTQLQPIVTD